MNTSIYRQRSLQEELLETLELMFKDIKKILYKHHTILGYF